MVEHLLQCTSLLSVLCHQLPSQTAIVALRVEVSILSISTTPVPKALPCAQAAHFSTAQPMAHTPGNHRAQLLLQEVGMAMEEVPSTGLSQSSTFVSVSM